MAQRKPIPMSDFEETVSTDDLKRKLEVEKNYHMEYEGGNKKSPGRWVLVIKHPETGEPLEKRVAVGRNWRTIWRNDA